MRDYPNQRPRQRSSDSKRMKKQARRARENDQDNSILSFITNNMLLIVLVTIVVSFGAFTFYQIWNEPTVEQKRGLKAQKHAGLHSLSEEWEKGREEALMAVKGIRGNTFAIWFERPGKERRLVEVKFDATVGEFRRAFADANDAVRIYGGRELQDEESLADAGVVAESVLQAEPLFAFKDVGTVASSSGKNEHLLTVVPALRIDQGISLKTESNVEKMYLAVKRHPSGDDDDALRAVEFDQLETDELIEVRVKQISGNEVEIQVLKMTDSSVMMPYPDGAASRKIWSKSDDEFVVLIEVHDGKIKVQ